MIIFPNCKINLGLTITGKRADGYHDIETVFYPVPVKDALEIIPNKKTDFPKNNTGVGLEIDLTTTGITVDGKPEDNLCAKAYLLLKKDFPSLPSIKVHLHKTIPLGAGLGGGSANGAFMLKALNDQFDLGLSVEQLLGYALQLGSDCPFFIINSPCIGSGRGEKLLPILLDLSPYQLVLVNPGIHVNTSWAFSQINQSTTKATEIPLQQIIADPIETWKAMLVNAFEKPVFEKYPEVKAIKESLYGMGAVYTSMSGSGSSVYGLFDKNQPVRNNFPDNYLFKNIYL
ncbi:MAG: 4-(cytidine 5'-diphospho)-2-C-methyl-D-erythritol kinase [Ferruginibacter sp.]